jgi:hypothetical protein
MPSHRCFFHPPARLYVSSPGFSFFFISIHPSHICEDFLGLGSSRGGKDRLTGSIIQAPRADSHRNCETLWQRDDRTARRKNE